MQRQRRNGTVVTLAAALIAPAGWVALGGENSSPSTGPQTEKVDFRADAGVRNRKVLDLGGLTIRASCRNYGQEQSYLQATAETSVDNSVVAVFYGQQGDQQAKAFNLSDFDRRYGAWDFLGTDPDNTAGTLSYSRPDSGQLVLTFLADEDTQQGECVLGGAAHFFP